MKHFGRAFKNLAGTAKSVSEARSLKTHRKFYRARVLAKTAFANRRKWNKHFLSRPRSARISEKTMSKVDRRDDFAFIDFDKNMVAQNATRQIKQCVVSPSLFHFLPERTGLPRMTCLPYLPSRKCFWHTCCACGGY